MEERGPEQNTGCPFSRSDNKETTIAMHRPLLFLCLLLVAALPAQSPVDVGAEGMETTALATDEAEAFISGFEESNVGFLHIYVDPAADPL